MNKKIISDIHQLELFLSKAVREAIDDLGDPIGDEEHIRQTKMASEMDHLRKRGKKQEVDEADEEENSPTEDSDDPDAGEGITADVKKPSEQKIAKANIDDIVKTLNVLRSGRSTKDPEVKKALKSYVDGLTTGEQQSLFAFLSGLAQMMVGGETGKSATDPRGAGIKTKPAEEEEEVTVTVDKEKGTEAQPIVVGEVANKIKERVRLRELMRR